MSSRPHIQACAASSVASLPNSVASNVTEAAPEKVFLSLPGIHCAGCISGVERALKSSPQVSDARVNLTLKRVAIDADPAIEPEDLIAVLAKAGYEAHALDAASLAATQTDKRGKELLMRLAVAGFAMMNVMLLSIAVWSGASEATRDMFHWISALIALPAIAFAGQPFYKNAWAALRVGKLNMDVPISLAIILAAGMSVYETSQGGEHAYFDAALSLTFFLLAGRYLDHRTRTVARSAAQELAALEVPRALTADNRKVAVADVEVGDLLRVLPGARVPVDATVVEGASELDRSLLTGETMPVMAKPGAKVHGGEVNLTGPLVVRCDARSTDSALHRMADLVAVAENTRNRYTSLADKAARIYAPAVHLLALVAFAGWAFATGDIRFSINVAVAVLIITCPCALGLAVPAVTTAASGRLFKSNVLIKNATALERLAEVDTVVFDKTGTLTTGKPKVVNIETVDANDRAAIYALAQNSSHPLSVALSSSLHDLGVVPAKVSEIQELPGHGVEAKYGNETVRLGRADWVGADARASTATYFKIGDVKPVALTFVDDLRQDAVETIDALKARGMSVVLLSGDTAPSVACAAGQAGIDAWEANMLPADKAARLAVLAKSGRKVWMVGDGLNDTAALAGAYVSISPGSALDAARVVSDMVLLGEALLPIAEAVDTARSATRVIKENFAVAAIYNLFAVPLALAGIATPLIAALAMSGSSITVSLNALRLARK